MAPWCVASDILAHVRRCCLHWPLLDACIIGASVVSLATAYAVRYVPDRRHSLHRKANRGKGVLGR